MAASRVVTWPQRVQLGFGYGALVTLGLTVLAFVAAVGGAVLAGVGAGIGSASVALVGGLVAERTLRERVRATRIARLTPVRLEGDRLEIPRPAGLATFDLSAPLTIHTHYWHRPSSPTTSVAQYLTSLELRQGPLAARVWASDPVGRQSLEKAAFLVAGTTTEPLQAEGVELTLADLLAVHAAVRRRVPA